MHKRMVAASLFFSAVVGLGTAPTAGAKPGDLPVDQRIQCPDGVDDPVKGRFSIELDISSKGITLKVATGLAKPEPPVAIDAVCPPVVSALLEQWLKQASAAVLNSRRGAAPLLSETEQAVRTEREKQAQRLFDIAERCRQTGHYDKARTCYQQVHLLTPTTRNGRLAIDRLTEIEDRLLDSAEPSEPARTDVPK